MLELRPLPPDSLEARICSYECTFCVTCVESVHAKFSAPIRNIPPEKR